MKTTSRHWKIWLQLALLCGLILLFSLPLIKRSEPPALGVAVAKGQYMPRMALPELTANELLARDIASWDEQLNNVLASREVEFLYAQPLTSGEARLWRHLGCQQYNCLQATFYNYSDGGTIEAVVNIDQRRLLGHWREVQARPAPSLRMIPQLLEIAGQDSRVGPLLGDVRTVASVMVPMSMWLTDDDCYRDWCIDLTFPSPEGDGRILHIIINMHQEAVSRLFYTRGREDRSPVAGEARPLQTQAGKPVAQTTDDDDGSSEDEPSAPDLPFQNGCQQAYDWSVCWEMTANDGLDFVDATYQGQSVFSSAKIGQVEVYYAAWPGGYRDEIGFDASVPAAFGTDIEDLGDGFAVRQMFTEPFDWPNCVCCYRYEQIVRFFEDGSLDFEFVSHGPGCDDLSSYRPFWRIDLDLDDPENDRVWNWSLDDWEEMAVESSMLLFDDSSPGGFQLVTADGDFGYRWQPVRSDPLGVDDGRLFLMQYDAREGTGPIMPGPADTFRPPRQWVDDEALSGGNIVLWYIPILQTKKGEPWWCMPDPEPEFSPCNALLKAVPGVELLSVVDAPTIEPTATEADHLATAEDDATPEPLPTSTPRGITGDDAEEIILNSGCGSCHLIGELGEAGKVGPDLSDIGRVAAQRQEGVVAEEYLRQAIVVPNDFIAPDCPNTPCLPNVMPQNFGQRLSERQLDILVAYLLNLVDETASVAEPGVGEDASTAGGNTSQPSPEEERPALIPRPVDGAPVFLILGLVLLLLVALGGIVILVRR